MSENRLDNISAARDVAPKVSDTVAALSNAANSSDGQQTLQTARAGAGDTAQAHLPTLDINFGQTNGSSAEGNITRNADGTISVVKSDGQGDTTTTRNYSQQRVTSIDSKSIDGTEKVASYGYDAQTGIKNAEYHSTIDSQHNFQSTFAQYDGHSGQLTDFSKLDSRTRAGIHDHYENGKLDYEVFADNKGDTGTLYLGQGTNTIDYQESSHTDGGKKPDTDKQQLIDETEEDKI